MFNFDRSTVLCQALWPMKRSPSQMGSCNSCSKIRLKTHNGKSIPHGLLWKRHVEQIRHRYGANQNGDPGKITGTQTKVDSRHSIVKPTTPESSQVLFDPISHLRRSERIRHKFAHKL
ncbi:hypothetical protein HELRODRAFT_182494 [Helobdella robusta]|uniref:Uncharacterized protein n=1 Tax=Helobdella robusta TaxID=6412 RepID=T1FI97_HELRO|nr:hypothetical protein HELRODRAFT_182494 [Helobdella robusta]ESN90906.1 hypothetical protein HELRODRAFT_182494 [Helobdella robusta]